MTENPIEMSAALAHAWDRMKTILFRPFDLSKWIALGFTAWLAGLTQGGRNFGWNLGDGPSSGESELTSLGSASVARIFGVGSGSVHVSSNVEAGIDWPKLGDWGRWLLEHPLWLVVGVFAFGFFLVLFLVIFWVTSRGKFMFLDNVVHDRAEVVAPWRRYRRLGNSHLGFQLAFYGILIVAVLASVVLGLAMASGSAPRAAGPGWIFVVCGVLLVAITVAYVQYFLDGFVVPQMHRYDVGVLDAWRRFGKLFERHPWVFLLSGPFLVLLLIAAILVILVAGVLTCCIGFLLIIIPYVGTVVLLPLSVTYRGFTLALLDQMEPGYFPDGDSATEEGPAADLPLGAAT